MMILFLAAYLGGMLTLLSPCILPVLPFLFARADQPFLKARLPMLAGMAIVFAAVAALASIGANWAIRANEFGRYLAMAALTVFGLALLSPRLAGLLALPGVALGNRLSNLAAVRSATATVAGSLLLGAATGLLWTPCAGPILGLVLSGTAWQGPSAGTAGLLLAYAAGAATSLGIALTAGNRFLTAMKRWSHAGEWIRRVLGAAVLAGVASAAFGAASNPFGSASGSAAERLETALFDTLAAPGTTSAEANAAAPGRRFRSRLPVEGRLPELDGAVAWLNSPPLTAAQLRGKVVLVDFWTYSCINCIRTLPYVRAWSEKYKDQGLVVIGVHTPEFAFEKKVENVQKALAEFRLGFPVAVDSNFRLWSAFGNSYWPAFYLVDAQGRIRYHHFGEGHYDASEKAIQDLLTEAGAANNPQAGLVTPDAPGIQAAPDLARLGSGETYLGYRQAAGFASRERMKPDATGDYSSAMLDLNQWSLAGNWHVGADEISLVRAGGAIAYRFRARDLHLVLGPDESGKPVRFKITVDGKPPGRLRGADIDEDGNGVVTRTRLYQLVRQDGDVKDRIFEVRFLDPGVQAYAFTFG